MSEHEKTFKEYMIADGWLMIETEKEIIWSRFGYTINDDKARTEYEAHGRVIPF